MACRARLAKEMGSAGAPPAAIGAPPMASNRDNGTIQFALRARRCVRRGCRTQRAGRGVSEQRIQRDGAEAELPRASDSRRKWVARAPRPPPSAPRRWHRTATTGPFNLRCAHEDVSGEGAGHGGRGARATRFLRAHGGATEYVRVRVHRFITVSSRFSKVFATVVHAARSATSAPFGTGPMGFVAISTAFFSSCR